MGIRLPCGRRSTPANHPAPARLRDQATARQAAGAGSLPTVSARSTRPITRLMFCWSSRTDTLARDITTFCQRRETRDLHALTAIHCATSRHARGRRSLCRRASRREPAAFEEPFESRRSEAFVRSPDLLWPVAPAIMPGLMTVPIPFEPHDAHARPCPAGSVRLAACAGAAAIPDHSKIRNPAATKSGSKANAVVTRRRLMVRKLM